MKEPVTTPHYTSVRAVLPNGLERTIQVKSDAKGDRVPAKWNMYMSGHERIYVPGVAHVTEGGIEFHPVFAKHRRLIMAYKPRRRSFGRVENEEHAKARHRFTVKTAPNRSGLTTEELMRAA